MIPDFKEKKVVVMGLGLNNGGVGVAKFFAKCGSRVLVTDLKTESELEKSLKKLKKFSNIEYHLGAHLEADFRGADLIVKNPAVPYSSKFIEIAKEANVPIETDISIFFQLCEGKIIGVTGTKGKSTVASLVYQILKSKYKDTVLAGNIGVSPLEFLDKIKSTTNVVLELSSFELEGLKRSPQIGVVTSIMPDHLDRYKDINSYVYSKKSIYKYQTPGDYLVLNYDYAQTRDMADKTKGTVIFYSIKKEKKCFVRDEVIYFNKQEVCRVSDLKIFGEHNVSNVMAAICVANILEIPSVFIKKAIKDFTGVPYRQEFVREVKGVKFFNDTAATMPDAVIEALKTYDQRFPNNSIILIAGGQDKGLDYKKLKAEIKKRTDCLILLPGSGSEKLRENLRFKNIINVLSMSEAVKNAIQVAKKGDVVILSPGAASFNLFKNEFDRGDKFVSLVKKIK